MSKIKNIAQSQEERLRSYIRETTKSYPLQRRDFIDPERIETIMRIKPPANKKAMQSFFGKINLLGNLFLVLQK